MRRFLHAWLRRGASPLACAVLGSLLASAAAAQPATRMIAETAPRDSSSTLWSVGAGLGLPYGLLGGKVTLGEVRVSGEFGVGIVPLAWSPAASATAVLRFRDRYAVIRPKLTATYSNAAGVIVITNSTADNPFQTLHEETFPGFGLYGGLDWRVGPTSPYCIDLNVGWVFPNGGNDKLRRRFDEVVEELEGQGYTLGDTKLNLDTPKVSIGVSYFPGGSKEVVYHRVPVPPPAPKDSDGDGVTDDLDREPNTPKGAQVDYQGVSRDDDGDGVPNGIDLDPNTPPGRMVDQFGRAMDADHDGVDDPLDECPDTPADYAVDERGCPLEVSLREFEMIDTGRFEETRIYFDTGLATLQPASFPHLDVIGQTLSGLPKLRFEVRGHCDDRGTDDFNQRLSEERARAVVDYLVGKFPDLRREQLGARGFGKSQPVTPGMDEESRRRNRRVEFVVLNREEARREIERKRFIQRGETLPDSLRRFPPARQ